MAQKFQTVPLSESFLTGGNTINCTIPPPGEGNQFAWGFCIRYDQCTFENFSRYKPIHTSSRHLASDPYQTERGQNTLCIRGHHPKVYPILESYNIDLEDLIEWSTHGDATGEFQEYAEDFENSMDVEGRLWGASIESGDEEMSNAFSSDNSGGTARDTERDDDEQEWIRVGRT